MRKVLIAETSDVLVQALVHSLPDTYTVSCCKRGGEVLESLRTFSPDLLILDLLLPELDGLEILKLSKAAGLLPKVLVLTPNLSAFVSKELLALNIDYVMSLPCHVHTICNRIHEIITSDTVRPDEESSQAKCASDLLQMMRFPPNRIGTKILIYLILRAAADPFQSFTKILYPEAASCFGGNGARVEHAVRRIIDDAWKHCDPSVWGLFFPADESGEVLKPTNSAFVLRMAEALKNMEKR